jgi:methyltransferase (TIGR00027 family)
VLDDSVRAFVARGGQQVLLLGAGFDCRAARLRDELSAARVFEVDHPATQAKKHAVLAAAGARDDQVAYLAWDFERDALAELPDRLAALGHDRTRPTLTIWEGVTMYLTEPAIDASVRAVRALSAPGSRFAITWFERRMIERPDRRARWVARFVARQGEPFRFGWDPQALPGWLQLRGFRLLTDRSDAGLAHELMPPAMARRVPVIGRHISEAEPA